MTRTTDTSLGWQPIETVPRDGTEVITICMRDDPPCYEIDSWYVGKTDKYTERPDGLYEKRDEEWGTWSQNGHRATHWMPLPKPPTDIEGQS